MVAARGWWLGAKQGPALLGGGEIGLVRGAIVPAVSVTALVPTPASAGASRAALVKIAPSRAAQIDVLIK
jgi:hypothetical protein